MGPAAQILTVLTAFGALARPAPQSPAAGPPADAVQDQRSLAGELAAAHRTRAEDLAQHAAWCHRERAYAERNQAWEWILELEPDNTKARRSVGYTRDRKSQAWIRRASYRAPRPSPEALAARAQARLDELNEAHYRRTLPLLDADGPGTSEERLALLRELLRLQPGRRDLLQRKGWVQLERDGEPFWGLPETLRAETRRPLLAELQRKLEEAWTPPEDHRGPSRDALTGIEWPLEYARDGIRVYASTSEDEASSVLRTCAITWSYAEELFSTSLPADQTLLVTAGPTLRRRLLRALAAGDQARFERLQRMAGDRKGTRIAIWGDGAPARRDAACRQTIAIALGRSFGIGTRHGWITEGLGMALCHRLVGTRLTYFVSTSRYVADTDRTIDQAMRDPGADWLALAAEALQPAQRPNLAFLLGRDVNSLGATDLVVSYALATYLLEAHPPATLASVLRRIGAEEAPARVLEDELGCDLVFLGERLHDWLLARTPLRR